MLRLLNVNACFICLLFVFGGCADNGTTFTDGGQRDARTDLSVRDTQPLGDLPDGFFADLRPEADDRCGGGGELSFVAGMATLFGDTSKLTSQYGSAIRCGGKVALVGPQRYVTLTLDEKRAYRFTLEPQFEAFLTLFTGCSEDIINSDCSSDGSTGFFLGPVEANDSATRLFFPRASGLYEVAVDSAAADRKGAFLLRIEEFEPPKEAACRSPRELKLQSGNVTIKGTTLGSSDESGDLIGCGTGVTFRGPQVYYVVELKANTSYRIELSPGFPAGLYLFSEKAACVAENIDRDCSTREGNVMVGVPAGASHATRFTPSSDGRYVIAVDSLEARAAGDFTLSIEQQAGQGNELCQNAQTAALTQDKVTLIGDTSTALNDQGAHLYCGASRFLGPQRYYSLELQAASYRFTLRPSFDAEVAIGQSCLLLPVDCASGGQTGATFAVANGGAGSLTFTSASMQTVTVAIDSLSPLQSGSFELDVERVNPPLNGQCASAAPLTLTSGVGQARGDTGLLKNDLSAVSCGKPQPFSGPQAYFRLSLLAGQKAQLTLTPEPRFDAALYAFSAATGCGASAVDAACGGLVSDNVGVGLLESLQLSAVQDQDFIIVVDSFSPSEVGAFTLQATLLP
jgi:hypothetical protein